MTDRTEKARVYERLTEQQVKLDRIERSFARLDDQLEQLEDQMVEQGWMEEDAELPNRRLKPR